MSRIELVRANALLPCIGFLEGIGSPVERLLCDAGLSPGIIGDGERLLPLHASLIFLERAARHENLPELGLVVSRQAPFEQLGAYARLIRHSPTLNHALHILVASISLHGTCDILWLMCCGERALFCHRLAGDRSVELATARIQGEMLAVSFMIGAVRAAIGPTWTPDEVWLPVATATWQKDCETVLQIPVRCRGDAAAVVFPAELLSAPNRAYWTSEGRASAGDLNEDIRLRETSPASDLAGAIRQVVGTLLVDGYPDITRTAQAVGLSVRTLQRHLAAAGESYSHLVDEARYQACVRLMHDGDARLADIACELGYADQANFTRAFRRWTGQPPRAYRRQIV